MQVTPDALELVQKHHDLILAFLCSCAQPSLTSLLFTLLLWGDSGEKVRGGIKSLLFFAAKSLQEKVMSSKSFVLCREVIERKGERVQILWTGVVPMAAGPCVEQTQAVPSVCQGPAAATSP